MIDEFISREMMFESLKKINYSLDCRFEKDADLYISKQDAQEIKNMISGGYWQGIYGVYKTNKVSPNILTIELIKDAWLIKDISQDAIEYITNIFNDCEKTIFMENAKKVINNEIYSPISLKNIINSIYYKHVDIKICKDILDNKVSNLIFNPSIRKICIYRVLDECDSPRSLYITMREYLRKNQIYSKSDELKNYVDELKNIKDEEFIKTFARIIFDNEIEDEIDFKENEWYLIFRNLGRITFDICLEYLEENGVEEEFLKNMIRYLMAYQFKKAEENDKVYYIKIYKELFSDHHLRWFLIRSVKNIYDEKSKKEIINYFLEQPNLSDKQRKFLKDTDQKNLSTEQILNDLLNKKIPYRGRITHFNFLVSNFLKNNKNAKKLNIMIDNLHNENVQEWYILMIDQAKKDILRDALFGLFKFLKNNPNSNLEKKIKHRIEAKPESFNSCKDIISNYDFEFYRNVYMR